MRPHFTRGALSNLCYKKKLLRQQNWTKANLTFQKIDFAKLVPKNNPGLKKIVQRAFMGLLENSQENGAHQDGKSLAKDLYPSV